MSAHFIPFKKIFILCTFEFQLKLCKGISYAGVAAHADKNGRRKLAAMLVEHEPRSSKQVFIFRPWTPPLPCQKWKGGICGSIEYTHDSFTSGASPFKHRRGRYSFDEGDWKWWYWPCLSCSVSYLTKGNIWTTFLNKISIYHHVTWCNACGPFSYRGNPWSFLERYRPDPWHGICL